MPVEISNNINFNNFNKSFKKKVGVICEEIKKEALSSVKEDQASNSFWKNKTGFALESIDGETEKNGDEITISIGFKKGQPFENRGDQKREYGNYIANYTGRNEMGFLGTALSKMSILVKKKLGKFNVKTKENKWEYDK
jgi:hypothetical protein